MTQLRDLISGSAAEVATVLGTNPAANNDILETVPTGQLWELISISATLVTDANVANRRVTLTIDDGTNVFLRVPAAATQAASLTRHWVYAPVGAQYADIGTDVHMQPIPSGLYLPAGYRISLAISGRQAGDDFAAPVMHVTRMG